MNKRQIATALAALLTAGSALALDGPEIKPPKETWNFTLEPEHERVKNPNGDFSSDSLAAIFGYRIGDHKFDLKTEISKDHDAAASTGGKLEARYRYYIGNFNGFKPSIRVSAGENFQNGAGSFAFWTVQPKLGYESGNWEPFYSVRWRNSFTNHSLHNYSTTTQYLGVEYKIDKSWSVEPAIFHKSNDETSNGVKIEIQKKF